MNKYDELRLKYPTFVFEKYDYKIIDNKIKITFYFSIPGLTEFSPSYEIDRKYFEKLDSFAEVLIFHIGMIELISYWKATCSPKVIIKAGYLDENQINWFKKLYFYGLGELFYRNSITNTEEDFMDITCEKVYENINCNYEGKGNLIPIGGGKDSCVTMEILKSEYDDNDCFIINPKTVTLDCANIGGYKEKTITVKRILDSKLIELNKQGFINGHTPFSSLVAFVSYFMAYLNNKKYIILSNEASANEETVIGLKVNHQYSKTFEFENDFNNYTKKYFNIDIKYFSLLRPLSELQIGFLFSKYNQYHKTFRSCNVGSKYDPWIWCCNCPKCLFVYIILSPFLDKKELLDIFNEDLFSKKELLDTFIELIGDAKTKPFECVGTIKEVRYATTLAIKKYEKNLPFLLKYYKDNYELVEEDLLEEYNATNNLENKFESLLKEEINASRNN
ncbi:MAG: hypothetical protein PHD02_04130 [Bacilli bacterium]|nr:hypothetical protein [Bacilli bacterium]